MNSQVRPLLACCLVVWSVGQSSVGWLVGLKARPSVIISLKGMKLHYDSLIGALFYYYYLTVCFSDVLRATSESRLSILDTVNRQPHHVLELGHWQPHHVLEIGHAPPCMVTD